MLNHSSENFKSLNWFWSTVKEPNWDLQILANWLERSFIECYKLEFKIYIGASTFHGGDIQIQVGFNNF